MPCSPFLHLSAPGLDLAVGSPAHVAVAALLLDGREMQAVPSRVGASGIDVRGQHALARPPGLLPGRGALADLLDDPLGELAVIFVVFHRLVLLGAVRILPRVPDLVFGAHVLGEEAVLLRPARPAPRGPRPRPARARGRSRRAISMRTLFSSLGMGSLLVGWFFIVLPPDGVGEPAVGGRVVALDTERLLDEAPAPRGVSCGRRDGCRRPRPCRSPPRGARLRPAWRSSPGAIAPSWRCWRARW